MKLALNVAEKPSVARSVSEIIGSTAYRLNSLSKYNPVFQFDLNLSGAPDYRMIFTSVAGHIFNYQFPQSCNNWQTTDISSLYREPVLKLPTQTGANLVRNLQHFSKDIDVLILWLDCDMEGEAIAFDVASVCSRVAKKHIDIKRAHFSALTRQEVVSAIKNLGTPNSNLRDAVELRQELDLRIGASFTRFQTLKFGKIFNLRKGQFLSYGPCQFPTLGFVVHRHQQIQRFIPEAFWTVKVVIENELDNGEQEKAEFEWERARLFDKLSCVVLYEKMLDNPEAEVISVTKQQRMKYRPKPLNTIEFQKISSRVLKMSSSKAMDIAEKLYQKGFISYPRTETNRYQPSINLKNLAKAHIGSDNWGEFATALIQGSQWGGAKNGTSDDKAHPPIHPVKLASRSSFENEDSWRVYELITRHFLGSLGKDAVGAETKVDIKIAEQQFSTKGLTILHYNYLEVYRFDKWAEHSVPQLKQGDKFIPNSILMNESKTQPPNYLTEAELIAKMDKNGIGTDATIHQHIKTIQDRAYAVKHGSVFKPTIRGCKLVEAYEKIKIDLNKPTIRAQMEREMKSVATGVKNKATVLAECVSQMEMLYNHVAAKEHTMISFLNQSIENESLEVMEDQFKERFNSPFPELPPQAYQEEDKENKPKNTQFVTNCDKCQTGKMRLRASNNQQSLFLGCTGYPSCKNLIGLPKGAKSAEILDERCQVHSSVNLIGLKFSQEISYQVEHIHLKGKSKFCVFCDSQLLSKLDQIGWDRKKEGTKLQPCIVPNSSNQRTNSFNTMQAVQFGKKRGERSFSTSRNRDEYDQPRGQGRGWGRGAPRGRGGRGWRSKRKKWRGKGRQADS